MSKKNTTVEAKDNNIEEMQVQFVDDLTSAGEATINGIYFKTFNDDVDEYKVGYSAKKISDIKSCTLLENHDAIEGADINTFDNVDLAVDEALQYAVSANLFTTSAKENKANAKKNNKASNSNNALKSSLKEKRNKKDGNEEMQMSNFSGPKPVRLFGRPIYIENRRNVTKNDIINTLIDEYDMDELANSEVGLNFDESTGIVEIFIKFRNKG